MLLIAPSGNKGKGIVLSPGSHPDVLCVGAVDEQHRVADFSGRLFDESGRCIKPEVSAPGVKVPVPMEGKGVYLASGTSIACATVAGIAAAMLDANPKATTHDVKMALFESCTPAEGSRYGVIDAQRALAYIQTRTPYPLPEEVDEPAQPSFIDPRLISQCKRAGRSERSVEALVAGNPTRELLERMSERYGTETYSVNFFRNFDMAHVTASAPFFELLFEQNDLQLCSAVDLNYFNL